MIRLNMTAAPAWLTLAPGLRLKVAPLTTALMVSARADPAIKNDSAPLPNGPSAGASAPARAAREVALTAPQDWTGHCRRRVGRPGIWLVALVASCG